MLRSGGGLRYTMEAGRTFRIWYAPLPLVFLGSDEEEDTCDRPQDRVLAGGEEVTNIVFLHESSKMRKIVSARAFGARERRFLFVWEYRTKTVCS